MTAPTKTISKPLRFAIEAEKFGDWETKRIKKDDRRIVVARRGTEAFRFEWVSNPDGRGSFKFDRGRHAVGDQAEDFSNIKAALRIMSQPAGVVKLAATSAPRHSASGESKPLKVHRIPFNAETDDDKTILLACAGKLITWVNSMTGNHESAYTPRGGMHYRMDHSGPKRFITFVDQRYLRNKVSECRGFSSVDVKAIVSVA